MSFFGGLRGKASKMEIALALEEFEELLVPQEEIQDAFQMVRDVLLFTNQRLLLVDKQGLTGKKAEYLTVPYKSIRYFAIEGAAQKERGMTVKLWLGNSLEPTICKELMKGVDILAFQRALATHVLES